jgi:homoserine kinase type II
MAVFTQITDSEMTSILAAYDIGQLSTLREVGQGIENSNYFLTTRYPPDPAGNTEEREWVVTIYETLSEADLPFFFGVTSTLSRSGLPVPAAVVARNQNCLQQVKGKPLAIFPRFPGDWLRHPDLESCLAVADLVASLHSVSMPPSLHREQTRNRRWMQAQQQLLQQTAPSADVGLITRVLSVLDEADADLSGCPRCIVHGDLFRDNILFHEGEISGVIDFYHACEDLRLFDLAVAVNDWCAEDSGVINWPCADEMLARYILQHPLTPIEQHRWGHIMLLAAFRFWLSRLVSRYQKGYQCEAIQGDITKDPDEFRRKVLCILERLPQAHSPTGS